MTESGQEGSSSVGDTSKAEKPKPTDSWLAEIKEGKSGSEILHIYMEIYRNQLGARELLARAGNSNPTTGEVDKQAYQMYVEEKLPGEEGKKAKERNDLASVGWLIRVRDVFSR